jgi:phage shock protein E
MKWILIAVVAVAIGWNIMSQNSVSANAAEIDFTNAVILDVRTPQEFAGGHVDGAINISSTVITKEKVEAVAKSDQTVILYCRSGARASGVQSKMTQWGYTDVVNLRTQSGVEKAMAAGNTP